MSEMLACPDAVALKGLLDGNLSNAEQQALTSHLESCRNCQQNLESLAAGKETWTEAALRLKASVDTPEAALERVMAESKKEDAGEPAAAEVPLDFLSPSQDPAHLGRLGHYEVIEVIGRGGMSVVLKAFDPSLHRLVAIKVLAPQLATTAAARARFRREGFAAAAVSHEHVVPVYGVNEVNGLPYLVMEYIAGESLQERLDRDGPLELKEILRIGMQTAAGLAAAHAQGLVHRDIKPANILLHNNVARVKITDFGLARALDDATLTQSGFVAGTPQYMSPEQARGDAIDARTDLFSLGSVLYAMCSGRPPFRASTTMGVLKRVSDERPRSLREINPEVPAWLAEIVGKLHAKVPADRFQTAAEVAVLLGEHLAQIQQGSLPAMPTRAISAPSLSRPPGLFRRHPWVVAAALLFLVAGAFAVSEAGGVTNAIEFVATVLRIQTRDGTLIIDVDDPGVAVTLDGDEIAIHGAGPKEIRVKSGQHRVRASKDGKEVVIQQPLVTVTRGGKTVVRIRHEDSPRQATAPSTMPDIAALIGATGRLSSVAFLGPTMVCDIASVYALARVESTAQKRLMRKAELAGEDAVELYIQLQALNDAVQTYITANRGQSPPDLEALLAKDANGGHGPILKKKSQLLDPWGKSYRYDIAGRKNRGLCPDIWSETPIGRIGNWDLQTTHVAAKARVDCYTQLRTLNDAVQTYIIANRGKFPPSLEALLAKDANGGHGPILKNKSQLIDPWTQNYHYNIAGPKNRGLFPDIWSESPGGRIGNWDLEAGQIGKQR